MTWEELLVICFLHNWTLEPIKEYKRNLKDCYIRLSLCTDILTL